jgi:hypothetical protein
MDNYDRLDSGTVWKISSFQVLNKILWVNKGLCAPGGFLVYIIRSTWWIPVCPKNVSKKIF